MTDRRVTNNASLILSAGLFALADWLGDCIGNYALFYVWHRVGSYGWSNKAIRDFEINVFIDAMAAFCAGLTVLLVQVLGRRAEPSRRHTLVFSAGMGILCCALRWIIEGVASFKISVLANFAIVAVLAFLSALAIARFRWGRRYDAQRGFSVITSSDTPAGRMSKD